ncbi:MAG: tetratricopeptide repeat protein [Anaerolineae bacterium]
MDKDEFGRLLTIGIKGIAARKEKNIATVQDELGYNLGREGGSAIEYWRKGNPPDPATVAKLAHQCVQEGGMDRKWLRGFLESADHYAIEPLLAELFPDNGEAVSPPAVRIRHNLPQPDYGKFVGREREIRELVQLLRPHPASRYPVISIDGVAGVGKTTLALEVAYYYLQLWTQLPPAERFEAIVWTSAKESVLTGHGIIARPRGLRTLADIFTTISITLEEEEIIHARPEEQLDLVQRILTRYRTLLIVDNLETVDDDQVLSFIREVPDPTKVLVTTRSRIDVSFPVRLGGLPKADALVLVEQQCNDRQVRLKLPEMELIYQHTSGIPLAIVWSAAQLAFGYSLEGIVTQLQEPYNDVARFCFENTVIMLQNSDAFTLLLALALFEDGAHRDYVGIVAGLEEDIIRRDEGLITLEKLSLTTHHDGRFIMLPLTRQYCLSHLRRNETLEATLRRNWLELIKHIVLEANLEGQTAYDKLYEERSNILAAIEWCWANIADHMDDFVFLVNRFTNFLWTRGFWAENRSLLQRARAVSREVDALDEEAEFTSRLAYLLNLTGEVEEAKRVGQQAVAMYKALGDPHKHAAALSILGHVYTQQNQLDLAEDALRTGLEVLGDLYNPEVKARLIRNLAWIYKLQENYEAARAHFAEACQLLEQLTPVNDQLSYTYRMFGMTAMAEGNFDEARRQLEKSLRLARRLNMRIDVARGLHQLAYLENLTGNPLEACELAHQAAYEYRQLGKQQELEEIDVLIKEMEAKITAAQAGNGSN